MRPPWSTTRACSASASCTRSFTPFGDDHRVLRFGEELRRFLHRAAVALRRRARHVARDVELLVAASADRLLLQAGVEWKVGTPGGRVEASRSLPPTTIIGTRSQKAL